MKAKFFEESVQASLKGTSKFPEIVAKLIGEGVESYHVDLIRCENRYYLANGESYVVANKIPPTKAADAFSATAVEAAVRSSQAGTITYPEFMARIAAAGAVYYIAYLKGRRVTYFGKEGDSHTEYFPGSR